MKLLLPLKGYSRKKQTLGHVETPGVNKKRSGISRYDQEKNSVEFPWVLVFVLGIPMGVTRFGEISKDKVTNVKVPGVFFKKVCPQHPLFRFFLE